LNFLFELLTFKKTKIMTKKFFGWLLTILGVLSLLFSIYLPIIHLINKSIRLNYLTIALIWLIGTFIILILGYLIRKNRLNSFKNNISLASKKFVLSSILIVFGIIIVLFSQTDFFFNREAIQENKYKGTDHFGYASAFGKEEKITKIVKHPNLLLMAPIIFAGYVIILAGGFIVFKSVKGISE